MSEKSLARIEELIELFPDGSDLTCMGFECPLSESWIDFHVEVYLSSENLSFLKTLFEIWKDQIDYDKWIHFLERWAEETFFRKGPFNRIVLEFDLSRSEERLNPPNLFIMIDQNRHAFWDQIEPLFSLRTFLIERCAGYGAEPSGIGFMLGRSDGLRLCLKNISDLDAYLAELGHKLNPQTRRWLSHSLISNHSLEIDLLQSLSSRIGFNCHIAQQTVYDDREKWRHFLQELCIEGLANTEKKDALLSWFGVTLFEGHLIVRDFNHIKIVQHGDRPLEAKAYLRTHIRSNKISG